MSIHLHVYESTDEIFFKLVDSSGDGVNNTLQVGDVKIASLNTSPRAGVNVTNLPTLFDSTNMPGVYTWTPTVAEAQNAVMVINIKDQTATAAFIENCLIISTGGNANARFSG